MARIDQKWLYLIFLSIVWGSSFILIKKSLIGLTPMQLGSLRIIISGLVLFLVGFNTVKNINKNQWKWLVISGLLGTGLPVFLFAYAETEIDSAIAAVLNSLTPLNTILLGMAVFKIFSTRLQVIGVIIGFVGTAILIASGADLNPDQNYLYAGFVIISTLCYGLNVNIIKRHLQDVRPIAIAVGNFIPILIPAILVLFLTGFFRQETLESETLGMALLYIVILSVFGTALAKVMFNKLVQISTPVFASSVTYLMPIVSVIWGLLDGEKFSAIQGFATAIILFGVFLSNKKRA
ncbi:MAG: EamA family transporter [Bacteroidia bacterium]|nr:EamA family transporter [Bacteroidia bacterium]NND12239.1 EamA family transporter [Flavobacteriaceae bacterium]NNK28518.1 EamA family transporter [Flavobacteriaceae bacterium]RZV65593.1 MAG: permease [Flavobacteriaceae bacterium]